MTVKHQELILMVTVWTLLITYSLCMPCDCWQYFPLLPVPNIDDILWIQANWCQTLKKYIQNISNFKTYKKSNLCLNSWQWCDKQDSYQISNITKPNFTTMYWCHVKAMLVLCFRCKRTCALPAFAWVHARTINWTQRMQTWKKALFYVMSLPKC